MVSCSIPRRQDLIAQRRAKPTRGSVAQEPPISGSEGYQKTRHLHREASPGNIEAPSLDTAGVSQIDTIRRAAGSVRCPRRKQRRDELELLDQMAKEESKSKVEQKRNSKFNTRHLNRSRSFDLPIEGMNSRRGAIAQSIICNR